MIEKRVLCLTVIMSLLLLSGCIGSVKAENQGNVEELNSVMYVNTENCRIRTGPGETYDTENLLAKGESVIVTAKVLDSDNNAWFRIDPQSLPDDMKLSDGEYYILASLLSDHKPDGG